MLLNHYDTISFAFLCHLIITNISFFLDAPIVFAFEKCLNVNKI